MGMMGVGFGEVGLVTGYFNIIDGIYEQGSIASRTFSLDLGSVDKAQGWYSDLT